VAVTVYYCITKGLLWGCPDRSLILHSELAIQGNSMINQTYQSDSAGDSERLATYASHVFECEKTALEWLESSVVALRNQRPCDLWQTLEGREQIDQVLRKIEFGEFT